MSQRPIIQSSECVELTSKQANIYTWGWQLSARFRDAVCGRRFGKTFLGKAEMQRAARLASEWKVSVEDEIWYAAPTFKQAKRVFWRRLKQAIPPAMRAGKPNETECCITLKSGHVIRIVGLDSYDNLRGSGLFFLIIDEWADCPYEAWTEVLRPMLSTCKYVIDGTVRVGGHVLRIGTPKGFNHCYDTFMDGQSGAQPDCKSWQYTSEQGGNIPVEEIEAAKRSLDIRTFEQEYCASFKTFAGVVYYCFDRFESGSTEEILPDDDLHIGMDFNVGKMSAVVYVKRKNDMHAVDEIAKGFDTRYMIDKIKERYSGHKIIIYPDASGNNRRSGDASQTDISLLKQAGFIVSVNSRNPAVKDRVNSMNAMLLNSVGERRLFVNIKNCPNFTECLEKQIYNDAGEPDKKSGFDHMNDAGTYPVAFLHPINKQATKQTPLRI